jgi:transposase
LVDTRNEGIFSSGVHMSKRRRRKFTNEFKAETVKLILESGKTVAELVKQAEIDSGGGPPGALTTEEREEFRRLQREVRELRMEREILKKATVDSMGRCNIFCFS